VPITEDDSNAEMMDPEEPFAFSDVQLPTPSGIQVLEETSHQCPVEIEEIEDEDAQWPQSHRETYPDHVAKVLGRGKTVFEELQDKQEAMGESEWAPFESRDEWELAQWLMKNVGQRSIDEYLKLSIVSF
jgi:hypothetical protein